MATLIFVYNADSGWINETFDFFHKIIKPDTYSCSLCQITHHNIGKKRAWKSYIESLPLKKEFYHRDEFTSKFPLDNKSEYPAIFITEASELNVLISPNELNSIDLPKLITMLDTRILKRQNILT